MYLSQNAMILVMLMFVISTVYYATIDYKTKSIEDEIKIKKFSLYEKNLKNTIERNIDKIVEDAFVNTSYKIMKERRFFDTSNEAVNYINSLIRNETNKTLGCLKGTENITYNVSFVNITPTGNPKIVHLSLTVTINYKKKLNNGEVVGVKQLPIDREIKLSRIPDPYVYLNKFYYNWSYYKIITVNNFPNDNENHTFCIILNNTNFNYNHMYNPFSPREIRIVGKNNVLLPYWVQTWRGPNDISIIWVRCNKSQLINNNQIYLLYNSTTTVDRQNPDDTFILFDDFNYMDYDKWNVSGGWDINNGILTVQGIGSSVWTKNIYGTGYELMFRGNFTPVHAQAVGFFEPLSDYIGVGWDCYNWSTNWLYMRVGSNRGDYVPNGNTYLNGFYIYDLKRISNRDLQFSILDDTLNILYQRAFTNGNNGNNYPISINTLVNSNAKVLIDWIFLKDVNDITTTVSNEEYTNPDYKEEKPKTFTGTIYYGEDGEYIFVYNGSYSIIGLYTNKTDSWGNVGYKPLIEGN
ncbi:conserved protein of unknown function [Methanocaldococcus lauensis]|nr:conserved protein of unknown function [Methanocaldococcus lauensis]